MIYEEIWKELDVFNLAKINEECCTCPKAYEEDKQKPWKRIALDRA